MRAGEDGGLEGADEEAQGVELVGCCDAGLREGADAPEELEGWEEIARSGRERGGV